MSEVERIFDRFIDAFASDLLEIAQEYIDVEVGRALAVAQRQTAKENKADLKANKQQLREQKRAARVAAKAKAKADKQRLREQKRAARLEEKERVKAQREAEQQERQAEHDRLKQERVALKQELEAERRRLREATRKRPARQLPLDFDGLAAPKSRRGTGQSANSPPQLFVHKRKRDGQIEKLARNDASPPAVNADGTPAEVTPLTNGLAAAPVEASLGAE
ncbi:MAG: hypothetical protein K0R38_699 [Polyangiaceae bacterium]|jgi:hypothetical protein|nr:hypothetical protein [Polyangiaceae bacterium]